MKIGDKVSFLSETGGGVVAGFQGKNIVLVEDEDGFQIPTPINDVVVVSEQSYDTSKVVAKPAAPKTGTDQRSVKAKLAAMDDEEEMEPEEPDREITYKPKPMERKGGNMLSAYLAFVPVNIHEISTTRFEVYLVNDSNYFLQYVYMSAQDNSWLLRSQGELEPNTKLYIEEIGREELNDMLHLGVQLLAYKKDKPFILKPALSIQFRLDPVKFYKLHTFEENDFFETPALIYTLIENDRPRRSINVSPDELKAAMYSHPEKEQKSEDSSKKDSYVRRYEDGKGGNPFVIKRRGDENVLVVDLHASALLDNTDGLSNADILNYQLKKFDEVLEANKDKKGQKIVFIHGKGEGVLRHAIINRLNHHYKRYTYQDASFQEYGYGATQVTIR